MSMTSLLAKSLLALIAATVLTVLWKVFPQLIRPFTSPLRRLPGPPSSSWFFGNLKAIWKADNSVLHEQWIEQYGLTIKYKGLLNVDRLFTMDTRALNHVLTHSNDYQKPEGTRKTLAKVLGAGVLITEGDQHRQQRRIMNPAFGPSQIRELTAIFMEKAEELRDVWASQLPQNGEATRIDVMSWLSRATLDIIGLAGFNYQFDSLKPSGPLNELSQAFETILNVDAQMRLFPILQAFIPPLRLIPTKRSRRVDHGQKVMRRIGMELIQKKKAAVLAASSGTNGRSDIKPTINLEGRDLLTLLIKANMATDIPENQRLSDEDVLAQVPTFLIAGHETTSNATTWCLFALTQAPEVQRKLRAELLAAHDSPTMDDLLALPYLDAVVRETLRIHAPVPATVRVATKDDVIPLDVPVTDLDGRVLDSIRVSKGDEIVFPILAMNRAKRLWGEDALEFKPERWEKLPEAVSRIPGVWGNMLSFIGGPRACIGYRFSLVEMKALLFTLVRAFEFELAVRPEDVTKRSSLVQRPFILSETEKPNQMPLLVRLHRPGADSQL